jgi:hypothetical protein
LIDKTKEEWIPYPLRYKEQQQDSKGLFLTTAIFGSGYLMFIAIIGLKLGFL